MEPSSEPRKAPAEGVVPKKSGKNEVEQFGGIFGIVLVVVLLAAGGIYFLLQQQEKIHQNQEELQAPANS